SHAASTEESVAPSGSMNCMYRNGDSSKRGVGSMSIASADASRASEVGTTSNPAPLAIRPSDRRRETLCLSWSFRGSDVCYAGDLDTRGDRDRARREQR